MTDTKIEEAFEDEDEVHVHHVYVDEHQEPIATFVCQRGFVNCARVPFISKDAHPSELPKDTLVFFEGDHMPVFVATDGYVLRRGDRLVIPWPKRPRIAHIYMEVRQR